MSSRLTKQIKADLVNNLVTEVFAGRKLDLAEAKFNLFNLILNNQVSYKHETELNLLGKGTLKRFVTTINSISVTTSEGVDMYEKLPKSRKNKEKLKLLFDAKLNGNYYTKSSFTATIDRFYSSTYISGLKSKKGEYRICSVEMDANRGSILADFNDAGFWEAIKIVALKSNITRDTHKLISKLDSVLQGINTPGQLANYDPKLLQYLPKVEKVAKPLITTPEAINNLITCCKAGTKTC